jgi:hypothetical protein
MVRGHSRRDITYEVYSAAALWVVIHTPLRWVICTIEVIKIT